MTEKGTKELIEEMGIETDEDAGVSLEEDPLVPRKRAKR